MVTHNADNQSLQFMQCLWHQWLATQMVSCTKVSDDRAIFNLPATQTNRLQLVLNSAARAVTKNPKFHHITLILKSLHWLKINERIKYKYKVLSLANKSLNTGQPSFILVTSLHSFGLLLLSPLVDLLSPLVLK